MAIQVRRGNEADFDANKMLPGEWAVSLDTKYVRMCFAPGIVLRMASYESFETDMELIQGILEECEEIQTAIERIKSEIDEKASLTIEYSNSASMSATRASEEADRAHDEAERSKNYADSAQSATNVKIATKDTAGIIKGGDNYIAEDGTLTLITETTSTTMPNSCEGRLLFKEIRGKTEKLTSTGVNLLNMRDGVNAVGDGVTYTNRGDGTYSRVGTATGITGNAWFKGGYIEGVPSTEITNPIMTLKLGKSYFIGDCVLFSVTKDGISYGMTGAVTIQNEDAKIVGVRNLRQFVGHNYNDVIYPRVFEGLVDLGWEPYGVGVPFIRSVEINSIKAHDGNGNENNITFSKPIELNKIGDVQDAVVDGKPIKRITKKRITSDMVIVNNPDWANKQAFVIESFFSDGLQVYDAGFSTIANILCTHAPTSSAVEIAGGSVMTGVAQNVYVNLYCSFENCSTLGELKTFLDNNVVDVYYELVTPITSLPTADQVALNSIETFDGTTYLEFDSPLQPEFIAEYGTSKVGGVALESLLVARNNEIRISALETSAVNNI